MVLSGESKGTKGTVINRITWAQLPDGKVKQQWETSTDNGTSWKTSFVGTYEKHLASGGQVPGSNLVIHFLRLDVGLLQKIGHAANGEDARENAG